MRGKELKCSLSVLFVLLFSFSVSTHGISNAGNEWIMKRTLLQDVPSPDFNPTAQWLHALPRNTLNGTKVEPSLFVAISTDYYSSLGSMAIVALAVGVLGILVGICFCCLRFYMDSCGGKQRRDSGYSNKERIILKLLVFINAALLIVLIILGIIGNSLFAPGIDTLATHVESEGKKEAELLGSIEPRLQAINENRTNLRGYVAALSRGKTDTIDNSESGRQYVSDNDLYRLLILGFCYAFILVSILLSLIAAIFNLSSPAMIAAFVGFFSIFMVWFVLAVHFPVSVVVADMCNDIVQYTIEARIADIEKDQGAIYGDSGMDDICFCPNWGHANRTYWWADELKQEAIQGQQTLLNSSTTLNSTQIEEFNRLQQQIATLEEIQVDTLYLRDCRWLLPALNPLRDSVCSQNLSGAVLIWSTAFALSILLIPWIIMNIMGFKRFPVFVDDGFF